MTTQPLSTAPTAGGTVVLVLHAHLPYVLSHGKWPHGTDWLCEAVAESYLPLLNIFNALVSEGIEPRVTLSLTPVLCEQLKDGRFAQEFAAYCGSKIMMARVNAMEFEAQGQLKLLKMALFWEEWYSGILCDFTETYESDIVGAFKSLQDAGHLEILTCAATHAYVSLLGTDESVQAQVALGVSSYQRHFGRPPRGIWLPECAYRPRSHEARTFYGEAGEASLPVCKGTDEFLSEAGLAYFIGDHEEPAVSAPTENEIMGSKALAAAWVQPPADGVAPLALMPRYTPTGLPHEADGVTYPGAGACLDFHRRHTPGGHRLWSVTDETPEREAKLAYHPVAASENLERQAAHFCAWLREELTRHATSGEGSGMLCLPFDTELFGHRWFEGPQWLARVLKMLWHDERLEAMTASQYLAAQPPQTSAELTAGHCAEGLEAQLTDETTAGFWRATHSCESTLCDLVQDYGGTQDELLRTIVEQCARELLLMQSSDWPFLMIRGEARDYAELRALGHINAFNMLTEFADKVADGETLSQDEHARLREVQERDNPFRAIDLSWWASLKQAVA